MARVAPKFEDIGKKAPTFEDIGKAPAFEDIGEKVYEAPTEWLRTKEVATIPRSLTTIEKAGQAVTEAIAAPVRTIESMAAGGVGGLIRMGAEAVTIESAMERANRMIPGYGTLVEGLMRKHGPKKSYSFYNRAVGRLADKGKLIQDYWNDAANKGWEAPNPDIVEARWSERPISKLVSVTSSGLTSIGVVVGTTFLTKSPHAGLALLASSEAGSMYGRLRDEDVPVNQSSKLALLAGAWTYGSEMIGFKRLLAPSQGNILKALAKPGWEGIQEVAEGIGHNLLEYWGYNYRKPEDIPTAVKAMYDHAMDGWFDNLVGGIGAGGITSAVLHYGGTDRGKRRVKPKIGVDPDKVLDKLGRGARQVKSLIEQYDLSPTQEKTFYKEINKSKNRSILRMLAAPSTKTAEIDATISPIVRSIKEAELQQLESPPDAEQLSGKKIEDIAPRTEDHVTGAKQGLTPKQTENKLEQAELRYQELKSKKIKKKRVISKKVYQAARKRLTDRNVLRTGIDPAGFFDLVTIGVYHIESGIRNFAEWSGEMIREFGERIKPELNRIWTHANAQIATQKKTVEQEEIEELAFYEKYRNDPAALLDQEAKQKAKAALRKSGLPKIKLPPPIVQRSVKDLLALGHKIKKNAGLSDIEYRDFAEKTTGKRSMKDMNKTQKRNFVSALAEAYGSPGRLLPEDYDKPIIVDGKQSTMRVIYNEAMDAVSKLEDRKKLPGVIKKPSKIAGAWQWTKSFAAGIKNTPVFHLARILDGKEANIFSKVLDRGIERGRKISASHAKQVVETVVKELEDRGVTEADLAKMGRSVNPRLQTHQMISEGAATEIHTVKINNKSYEMTMAELIDVYLISNQEDGMRHLTKGGLVINGIETGILSEAQIRNLRHRVEGDRKAEAVADTILKVGEQIWKPSLNLVSYQLDGKDIATVENWWGLEVFMPRKLAGKPGIAEIKLGKQEVNFIEDKGMLHDRTKSTAPLIVRDVFNRFNIYENATAEYVGMAGPTRTSRTLLNDPDIAMALDRKGYGDVRKNITEIHRRAQSIPVSEGDFSAFFARRLPALYRAVLIYNPRVVGGQYTSVMNYGAYVSPKYLYTAELPWTNMKETLELSDIAWHRFHMGHSSLELGELSQSDAALRMWTGGKSSDINWAGHAIKYTDLMALTKGMKSAQTEYQALKKDGKLIGLSEEWWLDKNAEDLPEADVELWRKVQQEGENADPQERQAVQQWQQIVSERAEYLWQRSQPSWDKWNRSMLTSEKGLKRIALLFRSFHEKSLTIFNEAMLDYQNDKDLGKFATRASHVWAGYAANTTWRALVMATMTGAAASIGAGEWKLKEGKDYIQHGLDALLSFFSAFPIFGPLLKTTISRTVDVARDVKPSYTHEPVASLPIEMVNMVLLTPVDFADAVGHRINSIDLYGKKKIAEEKKAKEAFERGMKKIIIGGGLLLGLPMYEIKRSWPEGWWPKEAEKPEKVTQRKW